MCGISGIYDKNNNDNNITHIVSILKKLQHRGKDSCGISYKDKDNVETIKNKGTVKRVFGSGIIKDNINMCIGHVRYTTSSGNDGESKEIQPLNNDNISLVHNGNIPSVTGHDTTYIFNILSNSKDIEKSLIKINENISASYCFIIMHNENMYVMKDRYGIRPLSYGYKDDKIIVCSETIGLEGCTNITEVKGGELLKINKDGIKQIYQNNNYVDGICLFELIYFMNPHSIYNDILIKDYRRKLGETLADKNNLILDEDFIVIGIPNSGIEAAKAYSEKLNIRYSQSITKNDKNNEGRSFILKTNEERNKVCKKFVYNTSEIKNKKIIIVDDTIVRGNVMKNIIKNVKEIGVKEVHVRIPAPPVVDICQLGIAINSKEELIMNNRNVEEVSEILNIESLQYLDLKELTFFPSEGYSECFGGGIKEEIINRKN